VTVWSATPTPTVGADGHANGGTDGTPTPTAVPAGGGFGAELAGQPLRDRVPAWVTFGVEARNYGEVLAATPFIIFATNITTVAEPGGDGHHRSTTSVFPYYYFTRRDESPAGSRCGAAQRGRQQRGQRRDRDLVPRAAPTPRPTPPPIPYTPTSTPLPTYTPTPRPTNTPTPRGRSRPRRRSPPTKTADAGSHGDRYADPETDVREVFRCASRRTFRCACRRRCSRWRARCATWG
jgi:hypothetical protein